MPVTPSSQPRTTDAHALPSSVSSSSLTSSFSSSRVTSDLLSAAQPSDPSQSDILTSDRFVSSHTSFSKPRFFPLALSPGAAAVPRFKPQTNMGQSQARPAAPSPPPLSPALSTTSSAGNRLKRAWVGRRKKSEDISAIFTAADRPRRDNDWEVETRPPPSAMPDIGEQRLERSPSRGGGGQKLRNLPSVFGGRKTSLQKPLPQPVMELRSPPPPTPPPKSASNAHPAYLTPAKDAYSCYSATSTAAAPVPRTQTPPPRSVSRARSPALVAPGASVVTEAVQQDADKSKESREDWRKSDATMASHSTIRPGALSGNRSPRPVSLAESSHSGNTIVPPVNKRLSALITDAEFTMFEETDGADLEHETSSRHPTSGRPSPNGSLKARNRRSASLSLVPSRTSGKSSPPPDSQSRNFTDTSFTVTHDTPTLTRTAAAGIISPVTSPGSSQTTGNEIRGRLAAWTAVPSIVTPPPSQPKVERPLPDLPPPQPRRPPGALNPPPVNPTFRQTAVSMTGSLAPAAGLAMGFGKRAVEKVGRAWGGLTSSASNHSGYSSSSSTGLSDTASVYASSHHSGQPGRKGRRKAPQAFSNSSSISSLTSSSSEDHFVSPGPRLGSRLRGPHLSASGLSIVGGLLFNRDLRSAVRETAIDTVSIQLATGAKQTESFGFRPLESRLLPALVVRCAQHILRWGIQEEGLFRVSGRSSHVAKLRSEFDAGCDYSLIEAEPSDLDPHAVSSIFKTYLRELPAPILTSDLLPYFESALADEHGRRSEDTTQQPQYSNPMHGLRKPPSLSTLAMPNFAKPRVISEANRTAFAWLISQLPQENRDLIFTVVELIKATAARSKETKMPIGNLLLVFCPSLNISPTLLRVLCEVDGIWDGPPAQPAVLRAVQEATSSSSLAQAPAQHVRSASKAAAPSVDLRLPVIELDDLPHDDNKDGADDAASFVSAINGPCRTPSPLVYGSTIPPLSSSDSLDSSSVSEELVSPDPPSVRDASDSKSLASAHSLAIPDTSFISSRTNISVPFPSAGGSVPHSPIGPNPLSHKKSFTLLSFPHLRSESAPDMSSEDELSSPQSPTRRVKRPSLHLLFSKKSTSSLPSAAGSPSITSADPLSAGSSCATATGTRPTIHLASLPPRLETSISSSPIELGFHANVSQLRGMKEVSSTVRSAPAMTDTLKLDVPPLSQRSDSGGSSVFSTPQSTPIADFYRGRTTSLSIPESVDEPAARSASQASNALSIDVTGTQDDWTRSVLLAAEASQSHPP